MRETHAASFRFSEQHCQDMLIQPVQMLQTAIKIFKIHRQVLTWAEPVLISEKWVMYLISCFLQLATCWNLHSSRFLYWTLPFQRVQARHYVQNVFESSKPNTGQDRKTKTVLVTRLGQKHLMKHVDILPSESHKCFRTLLEFVGIPFLTYVILCFHEWHLIISELVSWYFILSWKPAPYIQDCHLTFSVRTPHCFVSTPSDIAGSYVNRPHVFYRKTGLFMGCSKCISNFKIIRKPIVVSFQKIQVLPPMKTLMWC